MSDRWTWRWIPDPPASFGDNPVFDWIRLCVVLATIMLAVATIGVIRHQRRTSVAFGPGQWSRFAALALAGLFIALTEVAVFGTVASPRLAVAIGFNVAGWRGVHKMRRVQQGAHHDHSR